MVTIDFTVEFDVNGDAAAYGRFIRDLRTRLDSGRRSHDLPVLRPQEIPPEHWFEVVLRASDTVAVTLRVRSDNLYVDACRAANSQVWFEFANTAQRHLFDGSTFLEFDGNYTNLERKGGRRDKTPLGQQQLITSVNDLNRVASINDRARALMIIIEMISEAIRLTIMTDFLVTNWTSGLVPTPQIVALENGWSDVSTALLQQDDDSHFRLRSNDMQITSALEAILYIAILLYPISRAPPRSRRAAAAEQTMAQYPEGRPLAEVFWVRIDNIDGEDPGQLFGVITAVDGLSTQDLYNRNDSDTQSVKPGENAELTGPSNSISAAGDFLIDLSLYDHDKLSPDDEISKGQISWNAFDAFNEYDTVHNTVVSGEYGSVTVNYIVLSDASEALIEIVLINGDNENPANVYGSITASNGYGDSQLFKRDSDSYVDVRPGDDIPLLRTSMAVPRDKSLVINAELYDQDTLSPDDEIAKGSATFEPLVAQSSKMSITGTNGEIEVRITWF